MTEQESCVNRRSSVKQKIGSVCYSSHCLTLSQRADLIRAAVSDVTGSFVSSCRCLSVCVCDVLVFTAASETAVQRNSGLHKVTALSRHLT